MVLIERRLSFRALTLYVLFNVSRAAKADIDIAKGAIFDVAAAGGIQGAVGVIKTTPPEEPVRVVAAAKRIFCR
jgi:hypothetical protein